MSPAQQQGRPDPGTAKKQTSVSGSASAIHGLRRPGFGFTLPLHYHLLELLCCLAVPGRRIHLSKVFSPGALAQKGAVDSPLNHSPVTGCSNAR